MPLQDITITASIGNIATQSYGQRTYISSTDEQSFPIEQITGSDGKVWPDFVGGTNYTVNLFVNVTQSWSGSNITPLGYVPYIHNTMEEFINGEFSGSNYIVTNGSLIDEECEQFLTVSTIPVEYKVFSFFKNFYQDPSNVFLDRNTAPLNGEIYIFWDNFSGGQTKGIYAKIARIDNLGNDNTLSLQELKQFRYTDTTVGVGEIIFNIINIAEYPDFYFYEVKTKTTTAVPGNTNYYLHALSASFTTSSFPAGGYIISSSNDNWIEYNDSLNYFDISSGIYTFGDTPNIPLQYTASLKFTTSTTNGIMLFGISSQYGINTMVTASTNLPAGTYTWTVSGSGFYNTKTTDSYLAYFSSIDITNVTASFIITQSVSQITNVSKSFTIEPYLYSNFTNSDCDVLMNNYSQNDISQYYQRVLYDNGGTTPSNIEQIISGTAEYAEINDYLYSVNANSLPRYAGVRTTSPNFNQYSINGLSNEELNGINSDSSLFTASNGILNAEQTTTYFAYFTSLKSNNPIFKGTVSPVIKYLIREDGTIFNPSTDDATYYNLKGSFETDKKAYVNLLNDTSIIFTNTQSILLSGESYTPILYTLNAANNITATFTSSINFNNLQGITSNPVTPVSYSFYAQKLNVNLGLSDEEPHNAFYWGVDTTNFFNPGAGTWGGSIGSSNVYEPYYNFSGLPSVQIKVIFQVDYYYAAGGDTLLMELWKSNGSVSSSIARKTLGPFPTAGGRTISSIGDLIHEFNPSVNDQIFVTLKKIGGTYGSAYARNFSLKIETLGIALPSISAPFWYTGSANSNTITSSTTLADALRGNYQQIDIANSGFDPIQVPSTIKVGDEIRFEYDESNTYTVIDTNLISGSGQVYLVLDKDIPSISTLNINHFVIRRKIKDSITGISLDASLASPIYEGFLLPEYPSETIKRNLPNIINDLSERNII